MRSPRRIFLAAITSAGILTVMAGLVTSIRALTAGETVDDKIEIPFALVGGIVVFSVLVTAFSLVREAELRRVALVSILLGAVIGAWLMLREAVGQ